MMTIFKRGLAALGLALLAAGSAQACDFCVRGYGALPGAGTYYGHGNTDANWTYVADEESDVVLGLGFKDRQTLALLDGKLNANSVGIYSVALGNYNNGGSKQHLSYEFSGQSLHGATFRLCIDRDPSNAEVFSCVDPATQWQDNASLPPEAWPSSSIQNSQNVGFGDMPGGAFDPTQAGRYTFRFEALSGNVVLDSVTAIVLVGDVQAEVPEPASLALMGMALAGLLAARRRKQA